MIPTVYEYNTKSRFSNISRTSWNWDFTKSMSSGEGEREEVIGGSGSDRGSVGDDSLACITSYLWNSVMKTRHCSRTSCGYPRDVRRATNQSGFGTKYQSMSYVWRVPHNTISLLIVDEYNDEVMKCPTTLEEWRAISDNFAGGGTSPICVVHFMASTSTASVLQTVVPYTITIKASTPLS